MELKFYKKLPDAMLPSGKDRDIHSLIEYTLQPDDHVGIPTGLLVDVPDGCMLQIFSKRTIAEVHQVVVLNAPAIIHPGSKAEIIIFLKNHSTVPYKIEEGAAIAQAALVSITDFVPVFKIA